MLELCTVVVKTVIFLLFYICNHSVTLTQFHKLISFLPKCYKEPESWQHCSGTIYNIELGLYILNTMFLRTYLHLYCKTKLV